jgi:hypothetical protein
MCSLVAGAAMADGPAGRPGIPSGDVPGNHALPDSAGSSVTSTSTGSSGAGGGTAKAASPPAKPITIKITKRCRWSRAHHRGTRTCRYYRAQTLIKKCVKKPGRRVRCRTYNSARAAMEGSNPLATIAGTQISSGFVQQPLDAVVRIYWNCSNPSDGTTCSRCSGSMIAKGLVLTAGHCVYSNYRDGDVGDNTGFVGYYNAATYYVVPGNTLVNGQTTADYGTNDLMGGDWGIIELNPNAEGYYPGDYSGIGTFTATWDQPTVDQLYSIGYPTAGAFSQAAYGLGNLQYFCNDTWSSATDAETDPVNFGNYYGMVVQPCGETGGASGGPVFTDVNGGWTIVGVNNRAPEPDAQGFGTYMLSYYFNDAFGALWNYVIQQVNAGE